MIFDAEGVVIDTEKAWDRGQHELLARRGITYDRDEVKPLLTGRDLIEGTRLLKRTFHLRDTTADLVSERLRLVSGFFTSSVDFVPGFEDFYNVVSATYPTGLATALDPQLFELVDKKLSLRSRFHEHVITLTDVGHVSKPAPDLFLASARQLAVDPQQCLVIEDSPLGIEAAHRARMLAVGLTTTYDRHALAQADVVVQSFGDIPWPLTAVTLMRGKHRQQTAASGRTKLMLTLPPRMAKRSHDGTTSGKSRPSTAS
ncbi:MAG: HAD family phosphatase [Candidatus Dormibacteraeota bacterium]|nr:HAD family phosphatase [Candidatus Dormibacteraeota bacterium]